MKLKTDRKIKLFIVLFFIGSLYLIGCQDSDSTNSNSNLISSYEISYLQVIQDNGNVPPETDRYIIYEYSRGELPSEVLNAIDEISTTSENLFCVNDGVTYEMNITNSIGITSIYVSNNRNCGRENEIVFIPVDDFEYLISLF